MWTAGLSITSTLLSLYITKASAQNEIVCNSRIQGDDENTEVATGVQDIALKLCDAHLRGEGHNTFVSEKGPNGLVLTITHSSENPEFPTAEECATPFNEIVEQCIVKTGVWGGTSHVDGLLYEIYQDDSVFLIKADLELRESAGILELEGRAPPKTPKKTLPKKAPKATPKVTPPTKAKPTPTPTPMTPANTCPYKPGGKGKISARGTCNIPEDGWMKIGLNGLADTSDLISSNPCKGEKRSVEKSDFNALLYKLLQQLDTEFGKLLGDDAGKEMVTIIWAGGISGIHLGSRGKKGATGDIDFLYHTKTPAALRAKFKTAIEATVKNNPDKLNQKNLPISNSLEFKAPDARLKKWRELSDTSKEPVAWQGKHIKALDGDWLFQLFGKMSRMYQMRMKLSKQDIAKGNQNGQHKKRDEQDAQVFFKKWAAANLGDLIMKHFTALQASFERDQAYVEAMVGNTIKLVAGNSLSGVDAKIKALSKAAGC